MWFLNIFEKKIKEIMKSRYFNKINCLLNLRFCLILFEIEFFFYRFKVNNNRILLYRLENNFVLSILIFIKC